MTESKLDQIKALREARLTKTSASAPPGGGVQIPTRTHDKDLTGVLVGDLGYKHLKLSCPVCEARRVKNLVAVRKHRAKKITKKI